MQLSYVIPELQSYILFYRPYILLDIVREG